MAYFGLSKPVIAKYDPETKTYSKGMVLPGLVGTTVTPNSVEGSLYADNNMSEHEEFFTYATVDAEMNDIPLQASEILFGHTVDAEQKSEVSKSTDESNIVGYGFCQEKSVKKVKSFVACWLLQVKFAEGADSAQTRGENISYGTPKLSGKAYADDTNVWREKREFATEAEAYEWLKTKAGITGSSS